MSISIRLAGAIVLSVITVPSPFSGARASTAPTLQRYTLCAASPITTSALARLRPALHTRLVANPGVSAAQVARASTRCLALTLRATGSRRNAVKAAGKLGNIVYTDSGRESLNPGTHVRLVCPVPGCAPDVAVGGAHPAARPPVLSVVLSERDIKRGSARVQFNSSGFPPHQPSVVYALTAAGSRIWCSFTSARVKRFTAVVVDGVVLEDPLIQDPICGGLDELFGTLTVPEAYALAGYLNSGPLAFPLRLHP